jgi:hypothetical protein
MREARQKAARGDMERRKATQLQAVARGYLMRRNMSGSISAGEPPAPKKLDGTVTENAGVSVSSESDSKTAIAVDDS